MKNTCRMRACGAMLAVLAAGLVLCGCSGPNKVNIELRKKNAKLQADVESLKRQHDVDVASIHALEQHATTVPVLAHAQISELFTVHGIEFGRLTGADPDRPGAGLKVYIVPIDKSGEPIKAAGSFVVEAFDLAAGENNRVGHWQFALDQAQKNWFGNAMLYTYVLDCPLAEPVKHAEITLKISFTDALTQRTFAAQKVIKSR